MSAKVTPLRAVDLPWLLYARLSVNPDGTKTGTERQVGDLVADAEREGITYEVVREDDRSASVFARGPRPEFEAVLVKLASGAYAGVRFWKLDRGFRRGDDWQRFLTVANATGRDWRSLRDGLDTRNGDRDMVELMGTFAVWQAAKESKNTSVRLRSKHRELALAGKHSGGGRRPFGLTKDWTETVPEEAEAIRRAAKALLGGQSLLGICRQWNEAGITPPSGSHWRPGNLRQMMSSWRLAGIREFEGELYATGAIPAILDKATVERLRARFAGGVERRSHRYLLSGLLYCDECGAKLVARNHWRKGQRRPTFACVAPPIGRGCGRVLVTHDPVEELVVAQVLRMAEHPELLARLGDDDETDYEALAAALDKVQAARARLAVARHADGMDDLEYQAVRNELLDRERQIKDALGGERLSALRELIGEEELVEWWNDHTDLDERQAVLRALIERVVIRRPVRRGGGHFEPERVEVLWRF